MRAIIAVAAVLGASLAMTWPADAVQPKKARKSDGYAYSAKKSDYYARRAQEESADCIRAESLDPAGDYKAYPCWARKALAPKDLFGN
jgi:hypothetical protein